MGELVQTIYTIRKETRFPTYTCSTCGKKYFLIKPLTKTCRKCGTKLTLASTKILVNVNSRINLYKRGKP